MSVQFEDNNLAQRNFGTTQTPKLAAWLISKGLAKDVAGANKIQLIAAVVFFAVALFLFIK